MHESEFFFFHRKKKMNLSLLKSRENILFIFYEVDSSAMGVKQLSGGPDESSHLYCRKYTGSNKDLVNYFWHNIGAINQTKGLANWPFKIKT